MKSISQYTQNNILVLPDALLSMKDAHLLYQQGDNAFFYKDLETDLTNVEFYCNAPCVIYIESGQEIITSINNHCLTLNAGYATILPQGHNLHSDYVKSTHNLSAFLVFFDEHIITEFLKIAQTVEKELPTNEQFLNINGLQSLKSYFSSIKIMQHEALCDPALMRLKQLELLHLLNLHSEHSIHSLLKNELPKHNPKRNLRRLLNNYHSHHLTVSDLATLSGRSLSSFNRDFRATYNMSPKQWLQDQRLQHANTLLSQNKSVTQTAADLGYDNISHFISSFKKRYNLTPKQFQKTIESE
jgi:AraC-like DNA-binding protein